VAAKNGKGNGHVPKIVDIRTPDEIPPRYRKGQRVVWKGQGGIVRSVRRGQVQVYWGTATQAEGRPGIEMVSWKPATELEPMTEAVVSADEIAKRTLAARQREIHR